MWRRALRQSALGAGLLGCRDHRDKDFSGGGTEMTTVEITSGSIRGSESDGVRAWLGVPYAAPPVGANRFRPPQPLEPWSEVRDALEYGPSCPQPSARPAGWTEESSLSEDCLYLNVWSPSADGRGRPVMVWIHGGGYAIGSGSWPLYDGAALARRGDVVVITVNHRLGPFGYLHLAEVAGAEFAASGNNGMLDLVAVLRWVRDNAAAFGGDPGNVTIFGESGGGAKVSCLLAMPDARGLFHRAAIQSGPGLRVSSPGSADRSARALLEQLDIAPDKVSDLWSKSAEEILAATAKMGPAGGMAGGFSPVLDGTVIPAHPVDALADGSAADVPVLIGCNQDEGAGGLPAELDEAGLRERLSGFEDEDVERILSTYRALFPQASELDVLSYATTDSSMRLGSTRLAEAKLRAGGTPVFTYFFTYAMAGRAGHGYEIAFVFDNIREPITRPSVSRQRLADQMSEAWIAFARDGDPAHAELDKWNAYSVPERSTMVFGRDGGSLESDPSAEARELWETLPAPTRPLALFGRR
jgi:para-nitrobenzyl esterase